MTTHYSRRPYDLETGCSGLECVAATAFDHVFVLVWAGLAVLALAALVFLPRAREVCETERNRTREEARAFERFARRVEGIDTAAPTTIERPVGAPRARAVVERTDGAGGTDGGGLRAVREAYRETVMDVSHYEEEYDEPLEINVAAEFDPDAAAALADGDRLTPEIGRALVQCASDAADGRDELVEAIDAEIASLERRERELADIDRSLDRLDEDPLSERSFDELRTTWEEVTRVRTRVETLLRDRQTEIHAGSTRRGRFPDPYARFVYLYQSVPTTYPVLAEATRLVELVTTAEARVVRALSRRA